MICHEKSIRGQKEQEMLGLPATRTGSPCQLSDITNTVEPCQPVSKTEMDFHPRHAG